MEKRRRARINKCLEELKVLVPDLTESGTRVDKADVLEMTVEHLTRMKNKRRNLTSNLSPHGKKLRLLRLDFKKFYPIILKNYIYKDFPTAAFKIYQFLLKYLQLSVT